MEWIHTPDSSNLSGFGYDPGTSVLRVEFKNGGTYEYYDVPSHVVDAMKSAPSKGQFLAYQIKGTYRYARV
ncbi:KTSC domain-containing protein [Sphingobium sp. AN641]|uniref:KTSC domain-containing protein n=1 Tax=Sphingobium sp. AN641 TaxID=3133443 RepID=UPI0030C03F73